MPVKDIAIFKSTLNNRHWMSLLVLLFCSACSQIDAETQAKIDYWDQQANIMTLLGPQKEEVFAWVYAIDPDANYSGTSLIAKLETLSNKDAPDDKRCIILSIKFGERERVVQHRVSLKKRCD
ncbi:hypothetical protein [Paraglaciecola hydrolytica]|uniref:Uncharacterized protein n=1 Tax=Paraglaciecola hydrolytica TaxID=1799789 RepID=A0A136A3T0_9ALTE|nr:hypothetical protein [Paraglaciecola hydrolytica]KXI29879.1 hypothetical protein AX660_07585 [Paraglaciecola hydrolytica]